MPTITKPTRITHTATLIDNIFTNDYQHNHFSGLLLSDISDRLPVFLITDMNIQKQKSNTKMSRSIDKASLNRFKEAVHLCDWNPVFDASDPNLSYNIFTDKLQQLYNTHFPFKYHKRKTYKPRKLWITPALVKSIKTKHKLFIKNLKHNTAESQYKYKVYRNKLNNLIKISKKAYYAQTLKAARWDLKETWKILKDLTKTTKLKSNYPTKFQHNGSTINDPTLIAQQFFYEYWPKPCVKNSR